MARSKEWFESINKPPIIEVIVPEEYEWALEYASTFRCPRKRDPLDCDGKDCPTKPKPICHYRLCPQKRTCEAPWVGCFEDYYHDCLEYLKALKIIGKVQKGEIKIQRQTWKVKLE